MGRAVESGGTASGRRGCFEGVGGEGVGFWIDERDEAIPKAVEAVFFEPALEEGFLDTDAEVLAGNGDSSEPARIGNVVGDEAEHLGESIVVLTGENVLLERKEVEKKGGSRACG